MRLGAVFGAAALTTLGVAPAFAAPVVSQASAQSLQLTIAGNGAVTQVVTATNDGTEENTDNSTVPTLADLLPGNSLLGAGVAPQAAGANSDGTSYACAGIAGTGGGIVTVGDTACNLEGQPLTLDLATLDLGSVLIGDQSALGSALNQIPGIGNLLQTLGINLDELVDQIVGAVGPTPLGELSIGGSLSAVQAMCTATPEAASGDTTLVDTSGGSADIPITLTLPGLQQPLVLANLPANPAVNQKVVTGLDGVTQTLIDALTVQINTMVRGELAQLNLGPTLLQPIQEQVVEVLVEQLQPLLQPLEDNILDITLNQQVPGDDGRSIEVTALDLQVLPAAAQFTGSSLVSGQIGKVSCGPNGRVPAAADEPTPAPTPAPEPGPQGGDRPGEQPVVPTAVDSGQGGDSTRAMVVLGATGALLATAGGAGLMAYRRLLQQ
jgi:hypothetical protein